MELFLRFNLQAFFFNLLNGDGYVLPLLTIKLILKLIQIVIKAAGQLQLSFHDGFYELTIGQLPAVDFTDTDCHVAIQHALQP